MLRPAVAATNRASVGGSTGLDVLIRSLIASGNLTRPAPWPDKVPARARAVNEKQKTALSHCTKAEMLNAAPWASGGRLVEASASFPPGLSQNPDKTSPFLRISKQSRAHYHGQYSFPEGWLVSMDTSHLAEHVGTAGTLFASV